MLKLRRFILLFVCFLSFGFLSIGYSALSNSFTVTGVASATQYIGVYISSVTVSNTKNVNAELTEINLFTETLVDSKIELGNSGNSTVTLEITVFNNANETYGYNATKYSNGEDTYDNEGITFTLDDLKKRDEIASKASKVFHVTFKYKDSIVTTNKILNSLIYYEFLPLSEIPEEDDDTVANDVVERFEEVLNNKDNYTIIKEQMARQEENDRYSADYIGNVLGTTEEDLAVINLLFSGKLNLTINGVPTEVKIMIKDEDLNGDGVNEMTIYMTTDPLTEAGNIFFRNYVPVYACVFEHTDTDGDGTRDSWLQLGNVFSGEAAVNGYDGSRTGTGSFDTGSWRNSSRQSIETVIANYS